jgi:hypothetical protein
MIIENAILVSVDNAELSSNTFTIPEGVTSVCIGAFKDCTSLSTITIPKGVTYIGAGAFKKCTNLSTITIPKGVTYIGNQAFYGCSSLSAITLPAGVTSIGNEAFYGCSSLSAITLPAGVTSIRNGAFHNCTGLSTIFIAADDEAEFNRIKALLPLELQNLAYPDYRLEKIAEEITKPLSYNPDGILDTDVHEQLESLLDEGTKTLARYSGTPQYGQKKKIWDSSIVKMQLNLGNIDTALAYAQENPVLNDEAIELLALELFGIDPEVFQSKFTNWPDKYRAMIDLFKNHYQNEHISLLLTQCVLTVVNKELPSLDQTLEHLKLDDFNSDEAKIRFDKCVPLSVIRDCTEEAIRDMNLEDDKKTELLEQMNQLPLMSLKDMHALFQTQPLKGAFEANQHFGTANLLPFETVYSIPVASEPTPLDSILPSTNMAPTLRSFGIFAAPDNHEQNPPELLSVKAENQDSNPKVT